MIDLVPPLTDVERFLLETIYRAFKKTRNWPTVDYVEREFDDSTTDRAEVHEFNDCLNSLGGLFGPPRAGGVWYPPDQTLFLRLAGLACCSGSEEDVGLFLATARWVAHVWLERPSLPSPQAHAAIERRAGDVVGVLAERLGHDPYAYQVELVLELMRIEPCMPHPTGPVDDRLLWTFQITREVRPFKDVSDVESFLDALPENRVPARWATPMERGAEHSGPAHEALSPDTKVDAPDPRRVMVVYGRNVAARRATFAFLRSLGLEPIEWEQAVAATGKGTPHNLEAVRAAMSTAQAVVVLLTAEDQAGLLPQLAGASDGDDGLLRGQPRQNVILEAGMAMAVAEERTILVELGDIRPASDFHGLNSVRISNAPESRQALRSRLETAGCAVRSGSDWLHSSVAGDFDGAIVEWSPARDLGAEVAQADDSRSDKRQDRERRAPSPTSDRGTRIAQEDERIENIVKRVLERHEDLDQPLEPETLLQAIGNPKLDIVWAKKKLAQLEAEGRIYRNPDGPGWYPKKPA